MNRKTTQLKRAGASLSIAIALIAPAVAHASSGGDATNAAARDTVAAGIQAPADRRGTRQTEALPGGGLDRQDAAVGTAIFVGIVLMGLWGHVIVGTAIGGATGLLGAGARLVTGEPGRGRGWSDWPGPAVARVEQRKGRHRPLARRPERKLVPLPAHTRRAGDPELH